MKDNQRLICIPKQIHSKVMDVFQVYSDTIVGILQDSDFEKYENLMYELEMELPFGNDIWNFFKENESTFKIFNLRYLEIQELGGDVEKIMLQNNQYMKYINGLRKKKIGLVEDENVLDPNDRTYWDRQNLFKEIIMENILKYYQTKKVDYYYTTVDDVLNFFSGKIESKSNPGKEFYNSFLSDNGDFDFNLSPDSIAKYMKSIARYFCKKRIHYKGHRLNIYTLVN